MDELFSCRNCIHNCGQSLSIGQGSGFCLQHESVIWDPDRTTCKYLHRKDLPYFVVDEGCREHAAEFAGFPFLVALDTKESINRIPYSEKLRWETGTFDPTVHALAQYFKVERHWVLISAFAGGVDGRRALTHSCLVRRFMHQCDSWTSSYRLVLGLLSEIDVRPQFDPRELIRSAVTSEIEAAQEATLDVVFARLSTLQEYGWHAGLEELMWASDALNGSLTEPNWTRLQPELAAHRDSWIGLINSSAKQHHEFFPSPGPDSRMGDGVEEDDR
jgi:hypothetical protein